MTEAGWTILSEGADYAVNADIALSPGESDVLEELSQEYLESSRLLPVADRLQARQLLEQLLMGVCRKKYLLLESSRAERVLRVAESNLSGLAFFDFLLADPELEEVSVIGPNKPVYVFHRSRGWLKTAFALTSQDCAVDLVNKMARPLGRRITLQNPRLDALLPDGSRLHATLAPVAVNGFEITLRKFREKPFTVPELVSNGTLSPRIAAALWLIMLSESSLAVAGNTGGGKTTLLNALFSFIPSRERIVAIEQTPELSLPQPHVVRLVASDDLSVSLHALVKDSLRMRPDRVVIGEVRDAAEAGALFDSLLAGQARGTYCTVHANSAQECLTRLKRLGAEHDELSSLSFIAVCKRVLEHAGRRPVERRRLTELAAVENGSALKLAGFDRKAGRFTVFNDAALIRVLAGVMALPPEAVRQRLDEMEQYLVGLDGASFNDCAEAFERFLE
ncbi:hypothetical protein AUJ14_02120 [Candidatus Micrarchaeota archaeon CG1_02_55_22]|nr:MAG: hypothetical protein AUJ14_02120 [Candidatus Micrarchaeota archaeon CG1_02_55_22]